MAAVIGGALFKAHIFFLIPCVKVWMEVLCVSDTMCPRHLYSYFLITVIERNGNVNTTWRDRFTSYKR